MRKSKYTHNSALKGKRERERERERERISLESSDTHQPASLPLASGNWNCFSSHLAYFRYALEVGLHSVYLRKMIRDDKIRYDGIRQDKIRLYDVM